MLALLAKKQQVLDILFWVPGPTSRDFSACLFLMCGWSSPIITPTQNPVAVLIEKLSKPSKMHIGPCDVAHIILHYETHLPFTNMWTVMAITTTNQNPVTVLVAAIKMAPQRYIWCHGACTYWQKEPIHLWECMNGQAPSQHHPMGVLVK